MLESLLMIAELICVDLLPITEIFEKTPDLLADNKKPLVNTPE